MSQDLLTQLAEYGSHCEERQRPVDVSDVLDPVVPIPVTVRSVGPRRGWTVAAMAAALVVLLVGGVALLAPFGSDDPVSDQTPVTSVPAETVTTVAPTEPEAAQVTDTTLAAVPVPPPGVAPKLEFVQAELPGDLELRDGVWFKGAMYATHQDESGTSLFRSVDGFDWTPVPDFGPIDNWGWTTKTDGQRLVNVSGTDPEGNCLGSDDSIWVNTSTDGTTWTTSEIKIPLPATTSTTGCFNAYEANFAVGPHGIVVTTEVQMEIRGGFAQGLVDPDDGVHIEVTGIDLERGVVTVQLIEEESGEVVDTMEIEGLGDSLGELVAAMEANPAWAPLTGPLLRNMAENGPGVGRGFAWFSVDGEAWQVIGDVGPLQGGNGILIGSIVATMDGFVATSQFNGWPGSAGPPQEVLWHSVDGTTWTEGASLVESHLVGEPWGPRGLFTWAGLLVTPDGDDLWTIEESPVKLFSGAAVGGGNFGFRFGDVGIVGLHFTWEGAHPDEIVFSADGSTWNRWDLDEIDPNDGMLFWVGSGDDFIVFRQGYCEDSAATCKLWVGRLP